MIPKFRFYHSKLKCMFEVVSISFLSEKVECIVSEVDNYLNTWRWSYGELLQSTGLKDKNGVEIFEGDVIHLTSNNGIDYKALIIFKDGGFCAVDSIKDDYSTRRYQLYKGDCELKIIGNKYEHPHLIKE